MSENISRAKRCCYCGDTKPAEDFWKNKSTKDGLQYRCKRCQAAANALCQRTPHGRASALVRSLAHQKTEKGMATIKRTRMRQKEKKATNAHDAVKYQIRRGRLPRPADAQCVECGEQAQHYHHHLGYEREHRLHVLPVCAACHKRLHSGNVEPDCRRTRANI